MSDIPALKQIVEGAILAADRPLSIDQMISLFEKDQPARAELREVLKEIELDCEGHGFELKKVASGYRFQVRQAYGEWVSRLWDERPPRYSRALLETLALIAYKQPITRGDIEEIRGVAVSTNIMRSLLEREWVRVVGHRDVPGRPAIYATTKTFLDYFDLSSLEELPTLSDIKDLVESNEELDLEEEVINVRSLDLDTDDFDDDTAIDDADLAQVTEKVNAIQNNIRNLFDQDDQADEEDSEERDLREDEPGTEETVADPKSLLSAVPEEILNAAFAEETPAADIPAGAREKGDADKNDEP
jgi:segregation and condensation protein B